MLTSAVIAAHPGWILTPEFKEGVATVAEAVAEGRRAAIVIQEWIPACATMSDAQTSLASHVHGGDGAVETGGTSAIGTILTL